jgi:Zn-dependent protease with chaperone function
MDFFTLQDQARKRTRRLVALFALAVTGTVLAVYAVFTLGYGFCVHESRRASDPQFRAESGLMLGASAPYRTAAGGRSWWNATAFTLTTGATLLLIGTGAALRAFALTQGGRAIAEMLGGTRLPSAPSDPAERRLAHVVEEMAIASGIPVPEVYVLQGERSINAFAAGTRPGEAVIGVTRGAVDQLSRDELQGVVAHEFSHILNGDMRLNMRLCIMTHGILFLAVTGRALLRLAGEVSLRMRGSRRDGRADLAIIAVLVASGLALLGIGSIGYLFAWLIQAAVSRQREFLADAAAVQFTRNPAGIAGALARLLETPGRARRLASAQAGELGHFLFSHPGAGWLGEWVATHPPLEERIHRIDPDFLRQWRARPRRDPAEEASATSSAPAAGSAAALPPVLSDSVVLGTLLASSPKPAQAIAPLRPRHEHLAYAQALIDGLPAPLLEAARQPFAARAVVLAVLHARSGAGWPEGLEAADPALFREASRLAPLCAELDPRAYLPLVDLAVPALRALSPAQYLDFRTLLEQWIAQDGEISLFEFALQHCLKCHLDPAFPTLASKPTAPALHQLATVAEEIRCVLGAVAYAAADPTRAADAFRQGVASVELTGLDATLPDPESCDLADVAAALHRLSGLTPSLRRNVLYAAAQTAAHDGVLGIEEAELLRALGDALNCPLPPFLGRLEAEARAGG